MEVQRKVTCFKMRGKKLSLVMESSSGEQNADGIPRRRKTSQEMRGPPPLFFEEHVFVP